MKKVSIYIHIPFCERKCYYCDFVSFPKNNKVGSYIDNLIRELALYKDKLSQYQIDTVFIGGGTPTSIGAEYIEKILAYIYENFNAKGIREITIEGNPGTIDINKASIYKKAGINRISLGLQSLNNQLLKSIGRIHTAEDFIESFKLLRSLGFQNINVDLMFGLPSQRMEDLLDTIRGVMDLGVDHISLYSLIVEDNTLLNRWHNKGLLELPSEDMEREMYHRAVDLLEDNGYIQYEISNFSKANYECKHNLVYWRLEPYLGVGLSSHSNLFQKRFWNTSNINLYNNLLEKGNTPVEGQEEIQRRMKIAEYIILGLRLNEGIIKEDFKNRFHCDLESKYKEVISKHIHNGLLIEDNKSISLTKKGRDLSNIVEVDFMP